MASGTYRVEMDERAGGYRRTYRLHVPVGIDRDTPRPLLVALHGGGSSGRMLERRSELNALAARRGWWVVYPNGEGGLGLYRHWNAGLCCATGHIGGRDDVGFVGRVIDDVARRVQVDPARVYLAGFSNGGMLAWRFAAEHPDRVAGVAAIAATFAGAESSEQVEALAPPRVRSVPLLLLYGLEDDSVPSQQVEASLDAWVSGHACRGAPRVRTTHAGRVRLRRWPGCEGAGPVEAWSLEGWGHRWPGRIFTRERDDGLRGLDAAQILSRFFADGMPGADPIVQIKY